MLITLILAVLFVAVLGHRRHCSDPVQLHLSDPLSHINNSAKEFRKRLLALKNDFEEVKATFLFTNLFCVKNL